MVPLQKDAIYSLVVSFLSLFIFFIVMIFKNQEVAFSAFGILGFHGLIPFLFYRKSGKKVLIDERDQQISFRSARLCFAVFWVIFVVAALLFYYMESGRSVPVSNIGYMIFFAWMIIMVLRAVVILVLYQRSAHE